MDKKEFNLSEESIFVNEDKNTRLYFEKDVKEFIKRVKKEIEECADKTDILDNERWNKFSRIFRKEIDKLAGDKLK